MKLGLEQLDQRNIDSRVYDILTEQIVSGVLTPGTRITEEQLASELGVSRTPVREAMRRLAQDELVELLPRRGIRIKRLSWQDVAEIYEIRCVLESLAASRAAKKMTEHDLASLDAQAAEAKAGLANGEAESALEFDANLHRLIVERSGNRRLERTLATLINLVSFFRKEVGRTLERAAQACGEHERILAALKRRDPAAAEEEMKAHVSKAGERILQDITFPTE